MSLNTCLSVLDMLICNYPKRIKRGGVKMFEISEELSWKIRQKRAKERLKLFEAAKQIGISRQTLRFIERGTKKIVQKTVYSKIVDWLLDV